MSKTGMSRGRPSSVVLRSTVSGAGEIPPCPDVLRDAGQRFWVDVFSAATWLQADLDSHLVTQAAMLADDMTDARAEITLSGRYQTIPNGSTVRSAAVVDLEKLQAQQNAYLSALGLTPSDRARLGVHAWAESDPLTELMRRRESRSLDVLVRRTD